MPDLDDEQDRGPDDDRQDSGRSTDWREIRADRPLNERNVAAYARLMEAETRLYGWREQRQPTTTWITEVLSFPVGESTDLWIAALGEKIAAMGGHLELTAVFENETLTLLREPGPENHET
jgi:hypothetical protein